MELFLTLKLYLHWSNPGKGIAPSSTPQFVAIVKEAFRSLLTMLGQLIHFSNLSVMSWM